MDSDYLHNARGRIRCHRYYEDWTGCSVWATHYELTWTGSPVAADVPICRLHSGKKRTSGSLSAHYESVPSNELTHKKGWDIL